MFELGCVKLVLRGQATIFYRSTIYHLQYFSGGAYTSDNARAKKGLATQD